MPAPYTYLTENRIQKLIEFLAIPTISSPRDFGPDMKRGAEWLVDLLETLGTRDVRCINHDPWPVVYGELGSSLPDAPCILVYGHYDVVAPGDDGDWTFPAFSPKIQNGNIYARGAADMKGPLLACLFALEESFKARVRNNSTPEEKPVKIKLLFEGAEEGGSWSIQKFLEIHRDLVQADLAFTADAGMYGLNRPSVNTSLKGLYGCRFALSGPGTDLHSGMYGGAVLNPNQAMAELVTSFHDTSGRIAIDGLYDGVIEPDELDREDLAAIEGDFDKQLSSCGVPGLWGDQDYTPAERIFYRPSLTVTYLSGGQPMNIIPSRCESFVSIRLVNGQDPDTVGKKFKSHLEKLCPTQVRLEIIHEGGYMPSKTPRKSKAMELLVQSLEQEWGVQVLTIPGGGGIPVMGKLQHELGIPSLLTGLAIPGNNIHGSNEHISLESLDKAIGAYSRFFEGLDSVLVRTSPGSNS